MLRQMVDTLVSAIEHPPAAATIRTVEVLRSAATA
jgi:hypothetical protein